MDEKTKDLMRIAFEAGKNSWNTTDEETIYDLYTFEEFIKKYIQSNGIAP